MKKLILLVLSINLNAFDLSSVNSNGITGYINTPSAFNQQENSIALTFDRNEPDRKIIFTASPFNWLEANLFYVDITGKIYPGGFNQSYKDKGFSFKLTSPIKVFDHSLAIGLNDLAGTGYYSSEYIVISNEYNRFEYSLGLGWGNYSNGFKIENPLISLSQNFSKRSSVSKDRGGSPDINNYFSGENASFFFGSSYSFSDSQKIIFEYDPTNTDRIDYPEPKTKINLGYQTKIGNYLLKISSIRGASVNFQLSFVDSFNKFKQRPSFYDSNPKSFKDLQSALEKNLIGLVDIASNTDQIKVSVKQNAYLNHNISNSIVHQLSRSLAEDKEEIIISNYRYGMKVAEHSQSPHKIYSYANSDAKVNAGMKSSYRVTENYPIVINNISPKLRTFLAAREEFLHAALILEDDVEIFFNESLFIIGNFKYSIIDNFDNLYIPPLDVYPNQVRSDIKKYLNELSDKISIGRLEFNYFKQLDKNNFFRFSGGLYEEMFGGLGFEYLHYPEGSVFSYGIEHFNLRKRSYAMDFNFLEYKNNLTRVNFNIYEPISKVKLKLSIGEYLAGDKGYTFEIARVFGNGVKFGAYFTRTDVSVDNFGEGSFDKGIRMTIPIKNIFSGKKELRKFTWSPLTKDPGALLIKSLEIEEEIFRYRR